MGFFCFWVACLKIPQNWVYLQYTTTYKTMHTITINYDLMKEAGLSPEQYQTLEIIRKEGKTKRRAGRLVNAAPLLKTYLQVARNTAQKYIHELCEKGLLERPEKTWRVRTSERWRDMLVASRKPIDRGPAPDRTDVLRHPPAGSGNQAAA